MNDKGHYHVQIEATMESSRYQITKFNILYSLQLLW